MVGVLINRCENVLIEMLVSRYWMQTGNRCASQVCEEALGVTCGEEVREGARCWSTCWGKECASGQVCGAPLHTCGRPGKDAQVRRMEVEGETQDRGELIPLIRYQRRRAGKRTLRRPRKRRGKEQEGKEEKNKKTLSREAQNH